jgi:hypothetical protein
MRLREKSEFACSSNIFRPFKPSAQKYFYFFFSEIVLYAPPSRLIKRDVTANRHET